MTDSKTEGKARVEDPLVLTSIPGPGGFGAAADLQEFFSREADGPLVYPFGGADPIPSARNPLILGETIFGRNLPEGILDPAPYPPSPLYAVRFDNCHLYPRWGAVLPAPTAVFEPSVNAARWKSPDLTQMPGLSLSDGKTVVNPGTLGDQKIAGCHILLQHWGGRNYGHFLFDCVPGILLFYREIQQGALNILTGPLNAWQQEILHLLGVRADSITTVSLDSCMCERLIWPSPLAGNLRSPVAITLRAAEYLRRSSALKGGRSGSELIYISRAGFPNRQMLNESELIDELQKLDFAIVRPEQHSVARQIELFSGAKVVVGEVGAALANLIFAPPGCKVVEIMPRPKYSLWIKRWCGLRDMDWYCIYADVPDELRQVSIVHGVEYKDLNFNYRVVVADVMQAVKNAMRSLSSGQPAASTER